MFKKTFIIVIVLVLCPIASAERQLDRTEILEIFAALTQSPRKAWISVGTIEAEHEEYRAVKTTDANEIANAINQQVEAYQNEENKRELTEKLQQMKLEAIPFNVRYGLANEYTMDSTVLVRVDGDKFYWQIDVNSRSDSVGPAVDLAGNYMTKEFNLDWNEKRVFAWDGENYVTYSVSANNATIEPERFPVNGPLTAGVVPWGHGRYGYENLCSLDSAAAETEGNGTTEIQLTLVDGDMQYTFILDPAKNYAVKGLSLYKAGALSVLQIYGNYQSIGGRWCPDEVVIERYDSTESPARLMGRDVWNFTSISDGELTEDSFEVEYENGAFIEQFGPNDEVLRYRYPLPEPPSVSKIDSDELKRQRLSFASAGDRRNCATASLKYVCDKLGTKCSLENLSRIVHGQKKTTTLAQMQQFAEGLGLNTLAVKTDIETLLLLQAEISALSLRAKPRGLLQKDSSARLQLAENDMSDCLVIVHLLEQEHFVVLGGVDEKFVRLIDLASDNFYYRRSIESFNLAWDGTALLVAKNPVSTRGNFAKLDNPEKIVGSCSGQNCTKLLQMSYVSGCTQIGCLCSGVYIRGYTRYGCETSTSGTCSESALVKYRETLCINDPIYCECTVTGNWTLYYIQACS